MKRIYVIIITCCIAFNYAVAQQREYPRGKESIEGLQKTANFRIGEQLPDFELKKIINSDQRSGNTADYKDRLLILDFWGLGCSSCIAALPHMDALQKQFGNKIKILPVTRDYEMDVVPLWKGNKYTKNLSIASVVEDKILPPYFECKGIPHEIWIYKGKVIGITDGEYVDAYNIEQVLAGKTPNWPVKNDFYLFDLSGKPLFTADQKQVDTSNAFVKYAAISDHREIDGFIPGSNSVIVRDPKKKTVRFSLINHSIYAAYAMQWIKLIKFNELVIPNTSQLQRANLWEVADKTKYIYEYGDQALYGYRGDWMRKHAICFESVNPDTGQTDQQVAKSVIADLNRLLGLNARWEKRKEKVWVLIRTDKTDRLKSKKAITYDMAIRSSTGENYVRKGNLHQLRDINIGFLTNKMNEEPGNPYVFEETGYKGNVDMDLNISSWKDIAGIRKAIAPYGLALKEEDRLVDRFVITEVNGGLLIDGQMQAEAKAKKIAQADMKDPSMEENNAFLELNKKKSGVMVLPSGLQYKIIKPGTGAKPVLNDKIRVQYTGTLVNGKIFDSSYETGKPAEVRLNKDRIIAGWAEALPLMPVGSSWELYVPAELAYGTHTLHGTIPANSNLVFQIELLGIKK